MKTYFKHLFIVGFLTTVNFLTSQVKESLPISPDFELNEYVKVPNSPEAAAFIKYGETPINLYRGTPEISIPVHNINFGNINVPISFSYDASGLKVDQISTWIGLGWNLNAGGVVTRQVMGVPDDVPLVYNAYSSEVQYYSDYMRSHPMGEGSLHNSPDDILPYFTWIDRVNFRNADFQPDLYPFNVNGLSGTIFIDRESLQAKCIENPNLKVVMLGTVNNITGWNITDGNGVQYQFRETEITNNLYSGSASYMFNGPSNLEYNETYVSAWKLTKILDLTTNQEVSFSYTDKSWYEKEILSLEGSRSDIPIASVNCEEMQSINGLETNEYKINSSYLKTIAYRGNRLEFILSGDDRSDLHGKKALRVIEVYNSNKKVKEITLDNDHYFGDLNSYNSNQDQKILRLKLDGLSFSTMENEYVFEYFDPQEVPARDSKSVDFWGYYNGKPNTTLIPRLALNNVNNTILMGADRTPDLEFTKTGILSKIQYPTGGYTLFEYGLNKLSSEFIENSRRNTDTNIFLDKYGQQYENFCDDNPSNPKYTTGNFVIKPDHEGTIVELRINRTGSTTNASSNKAQKFVVYRSVEEEDLICKPAGSENCTYGDELDFCSDLYGGNPQIVATGEFNIDENSGSIDLLLSGTRYNPDGSIESKPSFGPGAYRVYLFNNNDDVAMNLTKSRIVYYDAEQKNYIGGLRVLKTSDYSFNNQVAKQKAYIYDDISTYVDFQIKDIAGYLNTSGIQHRSLDFNSIQYSENYSQSNGPFSCTSYIRYPHNRSTSTPFDIGYSKVSEVTYSGNTFTGFKVFEFYNEAEGSNKVLFSKTKVLNGRLKSESDYDSNFTILSSKEYNYTAQGNDFLLYGVNFDSGNRSMRRQRAIKQASNNQYYYIYKEYLPCCITSEPYQVFGGNIPDYSVKFYTAASYWPKLNNTISKEFFDGTTVVHRVDYNYLDKHHFPISKVSTLDGIKTSTENYYYPDDVDNVSSLNYVDLDFDTELQAINKLKLNHRVATPIQTEIIVTNVDGDVQSKMVQRTNFKDWGNAIVLPKTVQGLKGTYDASTNTLEDRVVYHSYDEWSNPEEISKANGSHIYYIWGYKGQFPIAKLENFENSDITETIQDFIRAAVTASNNGDDTCNHIENCAETNLRGALNTLRNAIPSGSQMTSYTYDPLVGVTSITDPRNYTMYYEYDSFNRLKKVRNAKGDLVEDYQYNYSQSNNN